MQEYFVAIEWCKETEIIRRVGVTSTVDGFNKMMKDAYGVRRTYTYHDLIAPKNIAFFLERLRKIEGDGTWIVSAVTVDAYMEDDGAKDVFLSVVDSWDESECTIESETIVCVADTIEKAHSVVDGFLADQRGRPKDVEWQEDGLLYKSGLLEYCVRRCSGGYHEGVSIYKLPIDTVQYLE